MPIKGCTIDIYYIKSGEPHSRYKDSLRLNVFEEFKHNGPNIWKGQYREYIITITQRDAMSDIREEDITIEKQPDYKKEEGIIYARPSKEELAQKLSEHLNEIYD